MTRAAAASTLAHPASRSRTALRQRRLFGAEDGVSAVEFALFAPFLFFAAVGMIDIGLAVNERMIMDRLLRGGAHSAMQDPGADHVRTVIEASADASFQPGSDFTLTVERECVCSLTDNSTYYRMVATRTYPGLILPDIGLEATAEVQIR